MIDTADPEDAGEFVGRLHVRILGFLGQKHDDHDDEDGHPHRGIDDSVRRARPTMAPMTAVVEAINATGMARRRSASPFLSSRPGGQRTRQRHNSPAPLTKSMPKGRSRR